MVMKVLTVNPIRMGFAPNQVMKSMSRGKVHDPRAVSRVEVIIIGTDSVELQSQEGRKLALQAARQYIAGRNARHASGVYRRDGKWALRFEVEP